MFVKLAEGLTAQIYEEPVLIHGTFDVHEGPGVKFFYTITEAQLGPGNYRLAKDAIDNFGALEDYAVLDFSMGYSLTTRFELHARIENAADEEYEEVLGYYTARRATYAGVRMRF
jgi:outer membrane receptor protein involved in Fe transport